MGTTRAYLARYNRRQRQKMSNRRRRTENVIALNVHFGRYVRD